MSTLDERLALIDKKYEQKHRKECTYSNWLYAEPDSDYCTCDIRERKQAVQAEIDKLEESINV